MKSLQGEGVSFAEHLLKAVELGAKCAASERGKLVPELLYWKLRHRFKRRNHASLATQKETHGFEGGGKRGLRRQEANPLEKQGRAFRKRGVRRTIPSPLRGKTPYLTV